MYKILLLVFLIPLVVTATEDKGKYTKNKKINKVYTVNKNATLAVSNKYGNITIVTGNSDQIEMNISITTSGDNEERVAERLEQITVELNGSSSNVSAKTIIGKSSNSWNWGRKSNVNMEINYTIKMPITNNVKLSNDYGSIQLDKLEGTSSINCDYGKITIGELLNSTNTINIDYTNKSSIDFMKDGAINADYSTLHIEKGGRIDLNADYSHISFGMVAVLDFNCDYGDVKINSCGNLTGNSDYMNTSVGKLNGSAILNSDYGSIKINAIHKNFKKIDIKTSYSQIKLGVSSENSFNITASLGYGHFKSNNNFTFNKEITKTSSKYYEGYYNTPNSDSTITLKTSYGNITFTTN
ncbi:hypothetical protein ACFQ5N_10915 [Lutibacter holmesii]|uniref:Adhesin domain-containing protein n=1 Tax=Lutibacter holmesii TaxID=1137985 RepID=A0ABW3WR30_9FLAO